VKLRTEVQTWLKDWFEKRAKIGTLNSQSLLDVDYFQAGWLTRWSCGIITEIEQQFEMQFSDEDMQDPRS